MKKLALLLTALLLAGCAAQPEPTIPSTQSAPAAQTTPPTAEPTLPPDPIRELLDTMTTEEKVGQMFLARFPEENALGDLRTYHLGGYLLFGRDFENRTPEDIRSLTANLQSTAAIPLLLAVDEEGGTVCRVSAYPSFRPERFPSPRTLFDQGGMELLISVESEKAYLLSYLGLNVNMAPVCDITTQKGAFMYQRSLGQDAETTAAFASAVTERLAQQHVGAVLKHFPGYGANGDTHTGSAVDNRPPEELMADLQPFSVAKAAPTAAILISHNTVTAFDDQNPATLSPAIHDYLRREMGYRGVIITDALDMEAITGVVDTGEAAVLAVLAGNDLLCSSDYPAQYAAVLEAVQTGRIPMPLLDDAVYRILTWKSALSLLP